jgi:hypothetical protein
LPDATRADLEKRMRDLERRLEELMGFVLAVTLAPDGSVSDALRRRATELTDLFDVEPRFELVKSEPPRAEEVGPSELDEAGKPRWWTGWTWRSKSRGPP